MNFTHFDALMESIQGAVIVNGDTEGDALHFQFADGRILVFTVVRGYIALSLLGADARARLH